MRSRSFAGGFTLVELLLAVGIAATVLALTFSLYFAARRTADEQTRRRAGMPALHLALDQLVRDLTSLQPVPGHETGGLNLITEPGLRGSHSELSFVRSRPAPPAALAHDLRWAELIEIRYTLEAAPGLPGRLVRAERPLLGPGSLADPVATTIALGIDSFQVELRRGTEWQDQWQVEADAELYQWPQAARVTLWPDQGRRDRQPRSVDVLIPTGWIIERSVP